MSSDRIETAVQRIERALARIAEIADAGGPKPQSGTAPSEDDSAGMPTNVSQLVVKHEELRETVAAEIKRLDDIIGKIEG